MTIDILFILKDLSIAFVIGSGWAYFFGSDKRAIPVAGLLGGIGHCIASVLCQSGVSLIFSTLTGCLFIGIAGIYAAHIVHTPPVVFTMPACITMIPGKYAYRTLLGCIKLTDADYVATHPYALNEIAHNFILTVTLLFTLAIGVSVGVLLFKSKSIKDLKIKKSFLKKILMR
ncbi:MAG: threonine/serine exporter family protein [Dysgonamonadaceae bacterium]|nr:threonine/serine exporter family protein [Dysgonamonadaceae bacterium]